MNWALEKLKALSCPTVDRSGLEQLLGVSPRQALRILNAFGAHPAGNSLVLGREELIGKLTRLQQEPATSGENARRKRLARELKQWRTGLAARQVPIAPLGQSPAGYRLGQLPRDIRLSPGKLEISFVTGEELLSHLFLLAETAAQDIEAFQAAVSGSVLPE